MLHVLSYLIFGIWHFHFDNLMVEGLVSTVPTPSSSYCHQQLFNRPGVIAGAVLQIPWSSINPFYSLTDAFPPKLQETFTPV